ncbi:MAG: response regulator [Candidatus Moranbacteria bacterium]|nr:response regulator [Candidatus Moranbacteria bacterium]
MSAQTILLIEDDSYQISMYGTRLKNLGYTVINAKTMKKALQLAKETQPDLILLDMLLGEDNGYKILKKLKSDSTTKNLKVVILSNYKEHKFITDCLQQGALDYLVKSELSNQEFTQKVRHYLKD